MNTDTSLIYSLVGVVASLSAIVWGASQLLLSQQKQPTYTSKDKAPTTPPPPHLHSWVPYVGSGIAMGQLGLLGFIRSATQQLSTRYGNGTHISVFTATVLGDHCLFLADPADLMIVFKAKYQKYLDAFSLQKQFVKNALGASPDELQETFRSDLVKQAAEQYHHYLFKGPELERSMQSVQQLFLEWIPTTVPTVPDDETSSSWKRYNLYQFVCSAIFKASTGPFLSWEVARSDEAFQNFVTFDKGVIPLFNNLPQCLVSAAVRARNGLLQLVQSQAYWDSASPLMMERKDKLGISEGAMNRANLGLLWASSGNSAPAVFWLVLRLLEDPVAWDACLTQVQQIVAKRKDKSNSGTPEKEETSFTLAELDEMTLLDSAFQEALRMYQGNVTARKVVQGFPLETASGDTYWIPAGTKLMSIWSVLHMDPIVHTQPEKFRYDRFVHKGQQTYTFANGQPLKHDPIIPFGGGSHLCPRYVFGRELNEKNRML
jgi:hypothetical protein